MVGSVVPDEAAVLAAQIRRQSPNILIPRRRAAVDGGWTRDKANGWVDWGRVLLDVTNR